MENDNIFLAVKAAVVALMGAYGAAFGWLGWLILAWVGCMVLDWISGSAAAAAKGNWSSAVARAGIWHKGGMVVVVIVAAVADCVLGMAVAHFPSLGVDYTVLVLPVILVWYIFTELGSIAENATGMGANVPAWLTKLLAAGKQLAENQIDLPDDTDHNL
ncbi:phage holin family protein [Gemmiger formicilis]|uniref:phage holin family protein n=1 Tax=Gemmiger formicilis TaxID=745368 RepID=UPI00195801FF|nr:phage holin family protein [Gemmiger formicilis]MBM6898301.1 phage holin family protein [Gemmiger formicilis]